MARASFDDVLGTNYVPTHDERRSIAALIESKEQELSCLNDIIAPLLVKRDKLYDEVLAHKALLTPARCLIPELVSEVFSHSVNYLPPVQGRWAYKDVSLYRFAMPSVGVAPLVLCQICRRWRDIALSSPSLWSTISIPWTFSIEGLQEWISRAGSCNLSFSFLMKRDNIGVSKILASHQQRWSDVVLGFDRFDIEFGREFLDSLSPLYHSLQTLEVCTWPWDYPPDIPLVIGSAPNLGQLTVCSTSLKLTTLDDSPPIYLRRVDIIGEIGMHSADFLALLRLCPAVEFICANVESTFNDDEPHRDILTLPALTHMDLSVRYRGRQNFCVLEQLCLPALEELLFGMAAERWSSNIYPPQIISLIRRSCPPLKVLHVWGGESLPSVDIMEIVPLLPLLSTLHLEQLEGKLDGLIRTLTGPIPPSDTLSGCICPELNEIYFDSTNGIPPESIIQMILSRTLSGRSRLAHLTALTCLESEVLEDPRISDCIDNGLKFKGSNLWEEARTDGAAPEQASSDNQDV